MTTVEEKDPDAPKTYELDVFEAFIQEATRSREFSVDDVVRAQRDTGFYYRCTTAGRTSQNYPAWPRASNETVQDGSVVWKAEHPDDVSVLTISSVTWDVPSGITLDSQQESGHIARATFSGGTAGEDYEVTARITATSGAVVEKTITIPVREQ